MSAAPSSQDVRSTTSVHSNPTAYSLQRLLAAEKGKTAYTVNEAFLLQVFWFVPSVSAAHELIQALQGCGVATHRDTPCVPTYFFRVVKSDTELAPKPARTYGELVSLTAARKKLSLGIPVGAVHAELTRKNLSPALLDKPLDEELPPELRDGGAVAVECSELYLDERAFMEHVGSKDYLDSYGKVMSPNNFGPTRPITLRFGTPTKAIIQRMLEPVLNAEPAQLQQGCFVWKTPSATASGSASSPVQPFILSIDVTSTDAAAVAATVPESFKEVCSTFIVFPHSLRPDTTRVLAVVASLSVSGSTSETLNAFVKQLPNVARGESHTDPVHADALREVFTNAGLGEKVSINDSESSGYFLHEKASVLDGRTDIQNELVVELVSKRD